MFSTRDPVGLDGYAAALGTALGEPPDLPATSHAIGEEHLERLALDDPGALAPLRGRRVYLPPGLPDVEGTGTLGRAHTEIASPDGAVRHLNRFHDGDWAPVEPRCLRHLLAETDPGLFVDLHESVSNGERFHVTLRRTGDPGSEERAERVEQAVAAVQAMVEEYEDALGA